MNGGNGVNGQTNNNLAEIARVQKQSRKKALMGVTHAALNSVVQVKPLIQSAFQIRKLLHAQVRVFFVDI